MKSTMSTRSKRHPNMFNVVITQLVVTGCLALLTLPWGVDIAVSALCGGLASSIPNAFLIWRSFRYFGASAARDIAKSFYQGEAGKLALTALAFVLIFTLVPTVKPWVLFCTFVLVQAVNWLTPFIVKR